jgi:hypothetical protein
MFVPTKRSKPRVRTAKKLQVDVPEDLADGVRGAAAAAGVSQSEWIRQCMAEGILARVEGQAMSKLSEVLDRAHKNHAKLWKVDNRMGELYAQGRAIEEAQAERLAEGLARLGANDEALGKRLEALESMISSQRLLVSALVLGASESTRKALNRIMEDTTKLGKLFTEWRRG